MKITAVKANNHRRVFEVTTWRGTFAFPYAKLDLVPSAVDPMTELFIDEELAREGFTYRLASGGEDSVLLDQVLYYNEDPAYVRDLLLFKLTVEALERIKAGRVSKREIIRRLGTSPAQFYRLIDTTNHRKSVDAMMDLLRALDCDVDVVVRSRPDAPAKSDAAHVSA